MSILATDNTTLTPRNCSDFEQVKDTFTFSEQGELMNEIQGVNIISKLDSNIFCPN